MPTLKANFSEISSSYEALPQDTPFKVTIDKVEAGKTKQAQLDQLVFELTVMEPAEFVGRKIFDFVTLEKKDHTPNNIGYGRVKAYTEAVLGDDAANGEEIDTDALVGNACTVILKNRQYEQNGEQKVASDVAKVLPQ